MFNPVSTYRLQFHKQFTLDDLEAIIPYLKDLGVNSIYASPVFEAMRGSTHGYDLVNPNKINPEIGTLEQLKSVHNILQKQGMNWMQDIVPNHMAFHPDNPWICDILEKGSLSLFANFFDTPDSSELFDGRLMVPFLGTSLEEAIEKGELKVAYYQERLVLKYFDSSWPLSIRSYQIILSAGPECISASFSQLLSQVHNILEIAEPHALAISMDEFRTQLASLVRDPQGAACLQACIETINESTSQLLYLSEQQYYRLCHWQETDSGINFRRFFTINGLICLNIGDEKVFRETHRLIKSLVDDGVVQALRIDHIDGLNDPACYLERLRELTEEKIHIVAEKILNSKENLPNEWPVQGTTGYDFLAVVNNLFTCKSSKKAFSSFYNSINGSDPVVKQQILDRKRFIMFQHMSGELDNLTRLFKKLRLADRETLTNIGSENLKKAISGFLIYCPVYRFYGDKLPLNDKEAHSIQGIFNDLRNNDEYPKPAVDLLAEVILHKPLLRNAAYNSSALRFYQRCMQFTGPLMAKGIEDTLMYSYNRFIGHNDVGDSPKAFGISKSEFHETMLLRQQNWPLTLNATATHDTKRGEDVRARLNVLTDLPDEWLTTVEQWRQLNKGLKQHDSPDDNDEYFIYQTLVGAHPMPGQVDDEFGKRLQLYLEKALREAKVHSDWSSPNTDYEQAVQTFAAALLDKTKPFWSSFKTFHQKVCDYGIINSLSQLLLKFTCPGVPDVYQGCELWDLSLVDPDNRRAVDYSARQTALHSFKETPDTQDPGLLTHLWQNRFDGRIKLWLTHALLELRKQDPEAFEKGEYIPLEVKGRYKKQLIAFARRYKDTWYITVIPLHGATLCEKQQKGILQLDWKDTSIVMPPDVPAHWEDLYGEGSGNTGKEIMAQAIFKTLPVALLKLRVPENRRAAGVLMHITSLPSAYGIGDLGQGAREFARFLSRSCQKYWQILPLTPTELVNGHSPYSSFSSMAGNKLLISPQALADCGLLDNNELTKYQIPQKDQINYMKAERLKDRLLEKAWRNFNASGDTGLKAEFESFCRDESYWLQDFALYVSLKQSHEGKPWYEWAGKYKRRHESALSFFAQKNSEVIKMIKWQQFIFHRQWIELKAFCNSLNIKIIGDLPFYVSYDSADVWSDPEIFSLDKNLNLEIVAGVPPDYFNDNGQLWGMPVFNWEKLKERGYDWWIRRIKKNMELYDLLRLDHFRAFSEYWAVPAKDETAINGRWEPGPGADIFNSLETALGALPFIAEDLGDIDDAVYNLRDTFNLPGMKILQFAFGEDFPSSANIPHNYVPNCLVYTGTHDNNTINGWFNQEAGKKIRKRLEAYTGIRVTKKNIHHVMARLAYSSVAETAILPLQDICGLDQKSRMNTPASLEKNWLWRLLPHQLTARHERQLRSQAKLYDRA